MEDAKNYIKNKNNNIKDKSGVKGVWFEHRLPYVKLEDTVNWDPMHVLKNMSERIFEVWKGERFTEKVINFCRNIQVHPELKANENQPWSISNNTVRNKVFITVITVIIIYLLIDY